MFRTSLKNNFLAFCVFCAVIIFDTVSKKVVAVYFGEQTLGSSFFVFGYFVNDRGLFGLVSLSVVVFFSVVIFFALAYLFYRASALEEKKAISFILGGGVSNFWERLNFGKVTDIVAIGNLGVMNIADVAIFIGIVWYAIFLIRKYR